MAARGVDPVRHYVQHGAREGRDPNRLFSSSWYLANYPDVAEAGLDPLTHYILRGAAEGRSPGPLFDAAWYLEANPDVADSGVNPLLHFLRHGTREGRRPHRPAESSPWLGSSAQLSSPHDRNAERREFDEAAAQTFVAAVRGGPGHAALMRERPLISVVLPTRNRAALLPTAIESVRAQTYGRWELLVVDDGSTDGTQDTLAQFRTDPRIRVLRTDATGVAAARNAAMAEARGAFFAYLDSDNAWRPDFLEISASYLLERELDLVYSALETDDGWRVRYVGAEYDYGALSRRNFIDINVVLHRRQLYDARGGCDPSLRRMSDWDLVLRYAKEARVGYAPFVGCRYDSRLTRTDRITVSESPGWTYVVLGKHHLDWRALQSAASARDAGLVSIVIPVHGQPELTAACLAAIFESDAGCRFEVVLVDNASDPATATLLDLWATQHADIRLVRNWENLHFALGCNLGFAASRGATVVFLNEHTLVRPGWLSALAALLADPAIGAVQPKLVFPDGTVQSFGTVLGAQGCIPYELYRGLPGGLPHLGRRREVSMVTAACMAMRAADFAKLRGFDPIFIDGQEDADLCLRLRKSLGKCCLVEPASTIVHLADGVPARNRFSYANRHVFAARWKDQLKPDDAAIYEDDGYRVRAYAPDVPEWAPAGLAAFHPLLERVAGTNEPLKIPAGPTARALPSFAIKIACPSEALREEWGDYHFANSLSQALLRLGCRSRIDYLRTWDGPDADCDVDLVLRGLERFAPKPGRPALMWVISHPDLVSLEELLGYDQVFVASDRLARQWSSETGRDVLALLQCTDRTVFFPSADEAERSDEILFIGNSRNIFRPAVRAAIEAGFAPAIYGTRWESLVDPRCIKATVISNALVGDLYRKAGVVLSDHWPDMVRAGIVSNRVFDVLACGTPIVSDGMAGLPDGFAEFVAEFGPDRPIRRSIERVLSEDADRRAARRAFADLVRRDHSFDTRAEMILECAKMLMPKTQPAGIS